MLTLLDEALELWQFTRDGVVAEAETIPDDLWDWRPAPPSRSVSELVQHIAEFAFLASGELTRPDGDFQRAPYNALLEEYASHVHRVRGKDSLIRLLRDSHSHAEAKFRDAGEVFLLQYVRRFDGLHSTRLAWLYHAIEHESYHRGQLALYVRQMGFVPALTRAILGEP
jgi:uncharacterized damage-inducible protein DinB